MATLTIRFAFAFAGTAAWLGLAIFAFGGPAAFFSHPALVGLTVVLALLVVASLFAGGNMSSGLREDRGDRWVLVAFTLIGIIDGYLPAWSDRHRVWIIDGETTRWIGVVVFAAGSALRLWPVYALGDRFSGLVAIQPDHTLATTGIFRFIRNPSYLGLLVMTLGWGLIFRSGIGVLFTALLLPPLIARMHSEETLLTERFGEEYEAYRARTARLIPGVY